METAGCEGFLSGKKPSLWATDCNGNLLCDSKSPQSLPCSRGCAHHSVVQAEVGAAWASSCFPLMCSVWKAVNQPRTSTQVAAHEGYQNPASLPGRNTPGARCKSCHHPHSVPLVSTSAQGKRSQSLAHLRKGLSCTFIAGLLLPGQHLGQMLVPVTEHKWHGEREEEEPSNGHLGRLIAKESPRGSNEGQFCCLPSLQETQASPAPAWSFATALLPQSKSIWAKTFIPFRDLRVVLLYEPDGQRVRKCNALPYVRSTTVWENHKHLGWKWLSDFFRPALHSSTDHTQKHVSSGPAESLESEEPLISQWTRSLPAHTPASSTREQRCPVTSLQQKVSFPPDLHSPLEQSL